MTSDPLEALSALMDREPVDPEELRRALDHPDALEILRDFAAMRAALVVQAPSVQAAASGAARPVRPAAKRRRPALLIAAAAVVVIAASLVGLSRRPREARPQGPPVAHREVRFTEGVDWFRR